MIDEGLTVSAPFRIHESKSSGVSSLQTFVANDELRFESPPKKTAQKWTFCRAGKSGVFAGLLKSGLFAWLLISGLFAGSLFMKSRLLLKS